MVDGIEERDYYQGKVDAATPEQQQWVNAHAPDHASDDAHAAETEEAPA